MSNITGSLRKVTLDGVTYRVMADANIDEIGSGFETSGVPTSGGTMFKKMRRVQERTGVVLACNGMERDQLKALSDRLTTYPMSYETASGDVFRATGMIEFEKRETEEGKASIKMIPEGEWQSFLAA